MQWKRQRVEITEEARYVHPALMNTNDGIPDATVVAGMHSIYGMTTINDINYHLTMDPMRPLIWLIDTKRREHGQ